MTDTSVDDRPDLDERGGAADLDGDIGDADAPGGFGFDDLPPMDPEQSSGSGSSCPATGPGAAGREAGATGEPVPARPDKNPHRTERRLIRRAVELSQALQAADPQDRALLGRVLGVATDLPALTAAALTASRATTVPLRDLLALRGMDRADQTAQVAFMERPRVLRLWLLLVDLGVADRKRPAVDIAAAKATVAAVESLTDQDTRRIQRVIDLIRVG